MSIRSLMPTLWSDEHHKDVFQNLQNEVDRVFQQFQSGFPLAVNSGNNEGELGILVPRVNVSETDKQIQVNVELPGVEKDDVEVTIADKVLIIEGHKKTESEKMEKEFRVVERSEGRFKRVIPLGFDLADESIDAKCKDGVLCVTIDKPANLTPKARKIEVKNTESA